MKIPATYSHCRRRATKGFTLLEILLASVAFAMIVLAIKVVLMGSLEMRKRGQSRMDQLNTRSRILEVMEKDLRQCFLSETVFAQSFTGETMSGSALRTDQLEFYTASGVVLTNQPWGHLQKVRYYLGQPLNEGRKELSDGWTLYREVTRNLLVSIQEIPIPQALAHRISSLAFQYFDGETWQDNWDFTVDESKLPTAVRIRIEFLPDEEKTESQNRQSVLNNALPAIQTTVALMAVPQIEEEEGTETSEGEPPSPNP